jgi:hypothetical protein
MAAAVLIDSKEMRTISGLTIHDSYFHIRGYFTATNPGRNPLYFYVEMEARSAGLGLVNYSNATVTGVEVYNNQYGSIYGPYVSGYYYGGGGGRNYGPRVEIGAVIAGDYSSSPSPMLTIRDMTIDDGSEWFGQIYRPMYSGPGVPLFANTVLIENITVKNAWGTVIRFDLRSPYEDERDFDFDVRVTNSHFSGLNSQGIQYYFWPGQINNPAVASVDIDEDVRIDNNTFTQSYYTWSYIDVGSGGNNMPNDQWDKKVIIADNDFVDSEGVFLSSWAHWDYVKGSDELHILNNNLRNLTTQWNGPFYVDGYDTIRFIGNTLQDMRYPYTGDFYDSGGSDNGVKMADWLFKDNTFDNCTNDDWPEIFFMEFGGTVRIEGNEMSNMNGFVSIMDWTEYTGVATMEIVDNLWHDNANYMVEYGEPDVGHMSFTMTISDNEVYNNEDFFVNYWARDGTLENFDYDGTYVIEDNVFHNNTGGIIHAWGDISVKNNDFFDNAGPLLLIDYINLNVPDVANNAMVNNHDLFQFVAKDRGYQLVAMSLSNQALDCSGTALSLSNMEVTLTEVDITGAASAVVATNTFVNAYSSYIDGDTCEVRGDGLITTWWPIEVYVTWGDANGMDSGTPVSDGLVVFNTANGDYYTSAYAGNDGVLPEALYTEWVVNLAGVTWVSPYNMKVAAAGATNDTIITLDMALTGPNRVHLVLWDIFPPVVAITEPFDGAIFAKNAVETFGFVAEVGSGLDMVEYSTNGGVDWTMMEIGANGDWTLTMSSLMDGEVSLMVRAMDIAGNSAETMVSITVDTTAPSLTVTALPEITNMADVTLTGSVEMGSEVFVNGMSQGIMMDSALSIDHTLHEGMNVIVIEAMDGAGNMAMETLNVELDTHEPVLVVTGPAGGLITNADSVTVTGIVEVGATLTVGGTQVVQDETGTFSHVFTLSTGENIIEVLATDDATNANSMSITVTQDQEAPDLEILSPSDGFMTDADLIAVTISSDDDAMLTLQGRYLTEMGDVTTNILLIEGSNVITVTAMDPAGNLAVEEITVIRDTEPPSLVITSPDVMEVWTSDANIVIEGIALQATGVTAGSEDATYDANTGVFTVTVPLSDGWNNISVRATDGVNTVSQMVLVLVNREPPILNLGDVEAVIRSPSVTITGDTEPGIDRVSVEVGGITSEFDVNYDGTFAVTLNLVNGDYVVTVSVVDTFGNIAERDTGSFTVKAKPIDSGGEDTSGFAVEPIHIGLILAVIGIALIIAAYASANVITKRRREDLEESD